MLNPENHKDIHQCTYKVVVKGGGCEDFSDFEAHKLINYFKSSATAIGAVAEITVVEIVR